MCVCGVHTHTHTYTNTQTHTHTHTHILDLTKMLDLMEGSFMEGGCVALDARHCAIHRETHPF